MEEVAPLALPDEVTSPWVQAFAKRLLHAATQPPNKFTQFIPIEVLTEILTRSEKLFRSEPTLLEIEPNGASVTVVGDTHGQLQDACNIFAVAGLPSETSLFVFNGDFVDRGAWGLETLLLFLAWKLALPRHVFLLRGNHETALCTMVYGFKGELVAKMGRGKWKTVYTACKRVFSVLPLSICIAHKALVLHGGLFRKPRAPARGRQKRQKVATLELGSLADLRAASKGGMDPNGLGASRLASDVLWSDPVCDAGFQPNTTRNIGMVFGPDITETFLRNDGLGLILRSHEGPDAREGRDDLGPMSEGYTIDHVTPAGRLITVFSAPDYPQFLPESHDRYRNKAALAVLRHPNYVDPEFRQFHAVLPRPEAAPYYDLDVPDSDEELEPLPSDVSGLTDVMSAGAESTTTSGASVSVPMSHRAGEQEVSS